VKDGINIDTPATARTDKALSAVLRAIAFALGCWGISAVIASIATLLQVLV